MFPKRFAPVFRKLVVCSMVLAIAAPPSALGSNQEIDLDGNPANGRESRIETRVLSTFPVEVENTIYNNAATQSFIFKWPGAGPGGFDSYVTAGPDVGTIWNWSTSVQVFSVTAPITFTPSRGVSTVGSRPGGVTPVGQEDGVFMVPGKSIFPTEVTLSSASLTASLITFFSPEETRALCGAVCDGGECFTFIENLTDNIIEGSVIEQGCCQEEHQIICEDGCQSYLEDPNNCGGCGFQCNPGEICSDGACACPAGTTACGDSCVDLTSDPANCGACGLACGEDQFCSGGECACSDVTLEICDEVCVDLLTDPASCGDCDVACPLVQICDGGVCDCPVAGETLCGEACVDLLSDPANCGDCDLACPSAQVCDGGVCECPVAGQTLCTDACVDLTNDPLNCGNCGAVCPTAQVCAGAACTCPVAGETLCGDACVDLSTDPANCGTCGVQCASEQSCETGVCLCPAGETLCGDDCVDLQGDLFNCGACGVACGIDETCEAGVCTPICEPNETLCDGVCVDTSTDPMNCGGCGIDCTGAGQQCIQDCSTPPYCMGVCIQCDTPDDCIVVGGGGEAASTTPGTSSTTPLRSPTFEPLSPEPSESISGRFVGTPEAAREADGTVRRAAEPSRPTAREQAGPGVAVTGSELMGLVADARLAAPADAAPVSDRGPRLDAAPETTAPRPSTLSRRERVLAAGREHRALRDDPVGEGGADSAVPTVETEPASRPAMQAGVDAIEEAPVCGLPAIEQQPILPGAIYVQSAGTGRFGREVATTASIMVDGRLVAQGPCPQVVTQPNAPVDGVIFGPVSVATDDTTGDGLCQNDEEECNFLIEMENVGDSPCDNPVATLVSPTNEMTDNTIQIVNGTSSYPSFPGYPGPGIALQRGTNLTPFTVSLAGTGQAGDEGRVFALNVECSNLTETVTMPIVLGIGSTCDPATDLNGENYDHVDGLQSPVSTKLVPRGDPVNVSNKRFNVGSTVPLKLSLACGSHTLDGDEMDEPPEIVGLEEADLGPLPLVNINDDSNANPNDPRLTCGNGCEYQFRTTELQPGTYTITIKMPDSREYQAAFRLR